MAAVIAVSLGVALRAPLETTALALIVLGVAHNVFELRYLAGRFVTGSTALVVPVLGLLVTGIMLSRAIGSVTDPGWGLRAEIVLTYAVLAAAAVAVARHRPPVLALVGGGAVVACVVSLVWPAYYFVVMTHLHNVVPLLFLWELSALLLGRRAFRAVQLAWVVVLPVAILAGAADPWLGHVAPSVFAAGPDVVAGGVVPGAASAVVGARFLAVFAFMQLVHFVVWIWYFPRYTPGVTRAFESRVPALRGWRPWAIAVGLGGALAALFLLDYGQGRSAYNLLASYHAYLELAAAVVMLPVLAGPRPGPAGASPASRGVSTASRGVSTARR